MGRPVITTVYARRGAIRNELRQLIGMSWPDTTETDRQAGARLAETIERIRWRLWHGHVKRALDLIAETVVTVDATADQTEPIASTGNNTDAR